MRPLLRLLLVLAWCATAAPAWAQGARLLTLDDPAYVYIERLQRRGHLLRLNPTSQPYREGEVAEALAEMDPEADALSRRWAALVAERLGPPPAPGEVRAHAEGGLGLVTTNNGRLDPLRFTDTTSVSYGAGGANLFPNGVLRFGLAHGAFAAQFGLLHDRFLEDDPDGLDLGHRENGVRSQDAYLGVALRYGAVYAGRLDRRWGGQTVDPLLVSDNPRAYDHLLLRVGGDRLHGEFLLGELDSATPDGRFTGRCGDTFRGLDCDRRFLAAHRFDWRPSRRVLLSVQESILYSGPDAGFSLPYLLPLGFAETINNAPKNFEHNGFGSGTLWAQVRNVTVQGQLAFDDFSLGPEDASLALSGSVVAALPRRPLDVGAALTLVTARAYNTDQPPGRYLYALRGLGTNFSDFVHARAWADVYLDAAVPGLAVSPEFHVLAQGEATPRGDQVPAGAPVLLVGDAERTVRLGARVRYQPAAWWWVRADLGVNATQNDGFVDGASATRFVGVVEAGARVRLGRSVRLDW